MTLLLVILCLALMTALIVVASIVPRRSRYGQFELSRRHDKGDETIAIDKERDSTYHDVASLQLAVQALLLILLALSFVGLLGWLFGGLFAAAVAVTYGAAARVSFIRQASDRLYGRYESTLLRKIALHQGVLRWIRRSIQETRYESFESREQFEHVLASSEGIVTHQEKNTILSSLRFADKTVAEIMTPKSVVDTVKRTEILGPLVLDQLHKTGHSRFPVIDEDIDHIVGILYVRDMLTLDTNRKHTAKVESAMSPKVHYVRSDHSLSQVLSAFLSSHHHLFIVINEYRETVGIVTLEDTLEALLGRRIVDEFDAHDDMRAVAARKASSESAPNRSVDATDL